MGIRTTVVTAGLLLIGAVPLPAQLISPGKLITAHGELEGVRNCTLCHQLGERGAADAKCLECHRPLRDRVARRTGYHATVTDRRCAECHKDHFGRNFAAVQLDTAAFDHHTTGYDLTGAHTEVACRDCHRAPHVTDAEVRAALTAVGRLDATFLGLGRACTVCHADDDPHAGQFADQACDECHTERDWKRADRFDHGATAYPLTGKHRDVKCRDCHAPIPGRRGALRLNGIAYAACTDCHRDPHEGRMRGTCEGCHRTAGWRELDQSRFERGFDHERTRFPLKGRHAQAECAACHDPAARHDGVRLVFAATRRPTTYPKPDAAQCRSCHLDAHRGAFRESPGGIECAGCHGEAEWVPTSFDLARHKDTRYPLTGAHMATPCLACHRSGVSGQQSLQFRFQRQDCEVCHDPEKPHGAQFAGKKCDDCHDTRAFTIAVFDHDATRYPLDGAHRRVPCASCHPLQSAGDRSRRIYRPLGIECRDCHGDQP